MSKLWNVAVVGATGAIGSQMVECLEERNFPVGEIRLLATGSSAGEILEFNGKSVAVEELTPQSFQGIDIAFFAAGVACAEEFCPLAAKGGAVCIDNSSAWGMDKEVPLVVPEVNAHALKGYTRKGIIANPTGATIQLVVALKPLHDVAGTKRLVLSTYQAVSGTGRRAIKELQVQSGELLNGRPAKEEVYPHRIAFNCLPQIGSFCDNGYTDLELRIAQETAKIMEAEIKSSVTCVRVPVFYGHSESINLETERKLTAEKARELLAGAAGVELVDDPAEGDYPMAMDAAGQDLVQVGRIREDDTIENGLNLWVVADNIRKGAATNAVQIAELLIEKYLVK